MHPKKYFEDVSRKQKPALGTRPQKQKPALGTRPQKQKHALGTRPQKHPQKHEKYTKAKGVKMKIFYMMGKSSSGKDTIFNIIKEKLNMNTYVMYTTRPIREGEEDGKTYHYISNEEMQKYVERKMPHELIEKRTYHTIHGDWTYATIKDEQFNSEKDMLMIGTLESYNKIKEKMEENVEPIYIEVEDGLRLERAIKRERLEPRPKYLELCRRFIADSNDFSEENIKKAGIKKRFQNIELDKCVKEIINYITVKNKE